MGLDMYAYVGRPGQRDEFYEQDDLQFDSKLGEWVVPEGGVENTRELAYWRKHPSLHGWMEKLAERKNLQYNSFNGIELELTWENVDELENAVRHGQLPFTEGFFFGNPADNIYYEEDLKFCANAKAELFLGLKVFYNSSW